MKHTLETQDSHFETVLDILSQSFPLEERRDKDCFITVMEEDCFYPCYYQIGEKVVAILFYWRFKELCYIEHFAVGKKFRGSGIGESILQQFIDEMDIPIVLEVEKPIDMNHWRRISFYERNGFYLLKQGYLQPAYRLGDKKVMLSLMSYPLPLDNSLINEFVTKYHPIIYPILE
ncbi:GNAT family N-acetyltransferase [Halosquirtibacter laminarini]|uniref:GNAT family N-acetyltransferase n=1 Tax=Halosquirtibacter laminarini TaxID=3374600 RepID=A0AC61NM28_9BACT|nr:GNAT family N-acetyltransferase [Prolixibacteraceae bacterium]